MTEVGIDEFVAEREAAKAPVCQVCRSPRRLLIEQGRAKGHTYPNILAWLKHHGETLSKDVLSRHFNGGHVQ